MFYQSYKHYSSFKEAINIKGLLTGSKTIPKEGAKLLTKRDFDLTF